MMPSPPLGLTTRAVIKRIIDGDTIDVELRLPCRVRLLDCWAEELPTRKGIRAKKKLELIAPEGSPVVVNIPTSSASNLKDVMTFGRVLGHVWREGDEESFAELLISSGLAFREKP